MNEVAQNPIITFHDQARWPLLEVESQSCGFPLNESDMAVIESMDQLLDVLDHEAAGLAAVQIGYPKRIFMLRSYDENNNGVNTAYINPVILSHSNEMKRDGEACLSLPGMGAMIPRPKSLTLQFSDIDGVVKTEIFEGFYARCVSHEMDHLEGKLISHHLEKLLNKQSSKTKFGMVLTKKKLSDIENRHRKNKLARKARKKNGKK
jgi:peptide deformylase